ncbi:hypothetical protein B0H12DRAFT_1235181 [Mycena haematopus]|nr:hypothetical protein B0H12DRAFT_1235181 [Mycena haematopus]
MSQTLTPLSSADDHAWTPSMPNSDLWTLSPAADVTQLSPFNDMIPGRVVRASPLGRFPSLTADIIMASESGSVSSSTAALSQQQSATPTFAQSVQPSRSRITLGLGHPSTSKRPSSSPVSGSNASPRVNSSTIKRRTERFRPRTLHSIAEHPIVATTQQKGTSRPVPAGRKRSYAEAVSAAETPKKRRNKRATTTSPTTPATPTFTPGSPRCASKHLGGAPLSSVTALAPRYTSSGAPQAGPAQVQSPRVLSPTTMAGSPNFQSLDGAVLVFRAAIDERSAIEEKEQEELRMADLIYEDSIYGEDLFIKFKVHARLRIRFAARRLKMLF